MAEPTGYDWIRMMRRAKDATARAEKRRRRIHAVILAVGVVWTAGVVAWALW